MTQEPLHNLNSLAVRITKRARRHQEQEDRHRTAWQRDRDRIIHSSAFRRLEYKTQVFIPHEHNDHHRTRLTHSLEVAQVSRSIAHHLKLNDALAEALALAHDLGHPPFGHAGEDALQQVMKPYGGFYHNTQSLHILLCLEQRYALFDGLNPSWETVEGIAKHNGPIEKKDMNAQLEVYLTQYDINPDSHACLEAQVAALADDIAYNSHDIDDGLRGHYFQLDDLKNIPLLENIINEVDKLYGHLSLSPKRRRHETIRRLISTLIMDVCATIQTQAQQNNILTCDDVRHHTKPLAQFSPAIQKDINLLREFLREKVYHHPKLITQLKEKTHFMQKLFTDYMKGHKKMNPAWDEQLQGVQEPQRARIICDYIAGMTDRMLEENANPSKL